MNNINRQRLTSTFIDLVKIPSPSWKEHGVINYIINVCKDLDIDYEKYKCGDSFNLLAKVDGKRKAKPVLFSCHMDTVIPCDLIVPVITGKKISSDGSTVLGGDDKAAVASFLEALYCIRENGISHGNLEFLFSCAEETGLYGIKGFDLSLLKAKYGFVFDSSGDIGRVILKAPYHISMEIAIRGKAAHAGIEPEKGISAIRALAEILSEIPHGRVDSETTVNAGVISGGRATNIVADYACCNIEARSINFSKLKFIESRIKNIILKIAKSHGAKIDIQRRLEYSGFSIKKDDEIVKIVNRAIAKLRIRPRYEISGGGSDTNIINRAGIKAINLSIGMRNVHTTKEYILRKDLINGARLVLSIIQSV
jgi:tripeptide aminopeptidase